MYRDVAFDKVYVSALKRTRESVQGFIDKGLPVEALKGLNEISWGAKEGQQITPEEDAYYHWMLQQWRLGKTDLRIEGGESPNEVASRQRIALDHILSKTAEKTILICMHGRAIRILLCLLLNYPLKSMDIFEHQNLGLYEIDYTGSMFLIRRYNDTSHLREVRTISTTTMVAPL